MRDFFNICLLVNVCAFVYAANLFLAYLVLSKKILNTRTKNILISHKEWAAFFYATHRIALHAGIIFWVSAKVDVMLYYVYMPIIIFLYIPYTIFASLILGHRVYIDSTATYFALFCACTFVFDFFFAFWIFHKAGKAEAKKIARNQEKREDGRGRG